MDRPHTHHCRHCHTPVDCSGELEPNDDGWPVVRCVVFHLDSGQIDPEFLCDSCRRSSQADVA